MGAFPSPQRGDDGRRRGVLHLPMAGDTWEVPACPILLLDSLSASGSAART